MATNPVPSPATENPLVMFNEDIIAADVAVPELENPRRWPVLDIYLRGTTAGTPDIVTARTEAYIVGWRDCDPDDDF